MTTGFIQQEPNEGMPVTERTEVWFLFDDDNIYVARTRIRRIRLQPAGGALCVE